MKPQGFIFDMDGVLCDSEAIMAEAACRMFMETYGLVVGEEDFLPFTGTGEVNYLGGVANKYGLDLVMPRDKDRAYEIYLELIPGRLPRLQGAKRFVEKCKSFWMKTAVATGADRVKMVGNLSELGLVREDFDALISGDMITHAKPDPEIFLKAAESIGLSPAECIVVEDSVNGIRAGRAAGCEVLGITTSFDEMTLREAGATWIAEDLLDALHLLEQGMPVEAA